MKLKHANNSYISTRLKTINKSCLSSLFINDTNPIYFICKSNLDIRDIIIHSKKSEG